MELMKNLRWMCRVCAVNIRKRRSSSSAVPIFDTPQLLEKLKKYLHMDVEYNDKLPKSICTNCFKRLESVYSFAILAKKTENFLKDFISIAENNLKNTTAPPISARFQNEFASFALLSTEKQDVIICDDQAFNESDELAINLEVDEHTYKEMEEGVISVVEQPSSPGPLHFIPVKTNQKNIINSPEKVLGSPQLKNSLDQKRRNLKMILANNNAQATYKNTPIPLPILTLPQVMSPSEPQSQNLEREPLMYDCLNLGCVVKDMDLLKLILKALKWPFTKDTLNAQIHRLKNTRFRDVMVDPNLLQDTDLMQILSSYLSPILLHPNNANLNITSSNLNSNVSNVMSSLHTYKIPADTSVHLVSVPIESPEKQPSERSRIRRMYKPRIVENDSPIEILSDEDSRDVQKFEVNIDPALYFPPDSESQDNSTESLVMSLVGKPPATLPEKKEKVRKKQRRKEAHVKLHTGRGEEEELVIVNEEGQEIADLHGRQLEIKPDREETLLDAESLGAQFPLVAIIDDNSNNDEVWAEFKVVESPHHGETGENISSRNLISNSFIQQEVERSQVECGVNDSPQSDEDFKKQIKQEVDDTFELGKIKAEPLDQEATDITQPHIKQQEDITPSEESVNNTNTIQAVDIKTEPELAEHDCNVKLEQEAKVLEGTEQTEIQNDTIKEEQMEISEDLPEMEEQVVIEEENQDEEIFEKELNECDKWQKPKDCSKNKEKADNREKICKGTDRVTRSASRVQSLEKEKRIPRSSRRFNYSSTKKKDSRLNRPCKRMCKQCGYIFKKSSDIAVHRKTHR